MSPKFNIKNIGFIGLGVMGMPMCINLSKNEEFNVTGFDINKEKNKILIKSGLKTALNAKDIFENNDLVITCLPGGKFVKKLYFQDKMISLVRKNQIIIDMSTSHPDLMKKINTKIKEKKSFFADAPIARTRQAAIDGKLAIMVGSDQVVFESIKPVLELVGSDIIHCGDVGSGQFTKILNNMVLFQNVLALSEASKIAERYNLDCGQLFQNISKCSGDSFALKNHGLKSIIKDNYPNPAFSVKYAQKDLSYAIDLAKKQNINTPGCNNLNELFTKAINEGYGDLYFPVIKKVL